MRMCFTTSGGRCTYTHKLNLNVISRFNSLNYIFLFLLRTFLTCYFICSFVRLLCVPWLSRKYEPKQVSAKHYNTCKRNITRILDGRIETEKYTIDASPHPTIHTPPNTYIHYLNTSFIFIVYWSMQVTAVLHAKSAWKYRVKMGKMKGWTSEMKYVKCEMMRNNSHSFANLLAALWGGSSGSGGGEGNDDGGTVSERESFTNTLCGLVNLMAPHT